MKKHLFLVPILLLTVVPLLSATAQASCYGPTSLEVWTEITCIRDCGDKVCISGYIHMLNDVKNTAYIEKVMTHVEAKYKNGSWITLTELYVGFGTISPGQEVVLPFSMCFDKGQWTAYRNVLLVTLTNHPNGAHTFQYRLSFNP